MYPKPNAYERLPILFVSTFWGTDHGWGGGIRTPVCRDQNPVPYRLATPQQNIQKQY